MTWTLRLYDSDGVEVCWVTADPYDYSITHPDGDSAWIGLRAELEGHEDMSERSTDTAEFDFGTMVWDVYDHQDPDPKEHLELIRDDHLPTPEIESAQLADE